MLVGADREPCSDPALNLGQKIHKYRAYMTHLGYRRHTDMLVFNLTSGPYPQLVNMLHFGSSHSCVCASCCLHLRKRSVRISVSAARTLNRTSGMRIKLCARVHHFEPARIAPNPTLQSSFVQQFGKRNARTNK